MKRFLSIFLSILVVIGCLVPNYAFAADNSEYDSEFTQEEFEALEHICGIHSTICIRFNSGTYIRNSKR